jgi:hypothetical protein
LDTLLSFAEDLERRDAGAAASLLEVERLEREVEEIRVHGTAAAAFLASWTETLLALEAGERAASQEQTAADAEVREADAALERARKEGERLAAARAVETARDRARTAEAWVAETRETRARLESERDARLAESLQLAARAAELGALVRDVPPPSSGLGGAVEWASRVRGELLLERAALAAERDVLAREATELLASVAGEPVAATSVAGVRDRLERALGQTSA